MANTKLLHGCHELKEIKTFIAGHTIWSHHTAETCREADYPQCCWRDLLHLIKVASVIKVSLKFNSVNMTVNCTVGSSFFSCLSSSIIKCQYWKLCSRPLPFGRLIMSSAFCPQCNSTLANFICCACMAVCPLLDSLHRSLASYSA